MRRLALSALMLAVGWGLLAAAASGEAPAPTDNTFRLSLSVDIDYVDPALSYYAPAWALHYATGALLLNYPDAPAPRGSWLRPEVAAGFPTISKDGKTYTFTLKKSYRFSNGRAVTAWNFAWAIHRALHRRTHSPAQPFLEDVVGAQVFIEGKAAKISGVRVVNAHTLKIQTKSRAPDLLARLAMPFFQAVPDDLPIEPEGVDAPLASAGPYFFRQWRRNRSILLQRNRFYRGPRPHKVARIVVDVGLPLETIKLNIDRGATDAGDLPSSAHAELGKRFGVRRRSPGRYFVNPAPTIEFVAMNHDRPLFGGPGPRGNVALKRAVNFAIDRRAITLQGGAFRGSPHDQLLPPGMRGFRNLNLYPWRPNLEKAAALARGNLRSGRGIFYCSNRFPAPQQCQIVQANLRAIGLDVDIRLFPRAIYRPIDRPGRGEPYDMVISSWRSEYFDPYDFLFFVEGSTIRATGNVNNSFFDDPTFNARIRRARQLTGIDRFRAFSELDHAIMRDAAPLAVFGVANERHYVSARTGCYHYQPVYGYDFPALCLRR
jgi:ABC-type oligopeptide transport system substrate-binding subunit